MERLPTIPNHQKHPVASVQRKPRQDDVIFGVMISSRYCNVNGSTDFTLDFHLFVSVTAARRLFDNVK